MPMNIHDACFLAVLRRLAELQPISSPLFANSVSIVMFASTMGQTAFRTHGVAVTVLGVSTKLLYVEHG